MLKTYEIYLIKIFLNKLLNVSMVFFSLVIIMGVLEEISFFKDLDNNIYTPIYYSLLNAPSTLFEIFPFIFLISTQFLFLDLNKKNELEVFKINGLSNLKIIRTLFFISMILGLIAISFYYSFSSKLKFIYLENKNSYSTDNKYLAVVKESGLWIKDEIDNKIYIVNSDTIKDNFLINVSINEFDNNFNLIRIIKSKKVNIASNNWIISKPIVFFENNSTQNLNDISVTMHFNQKKINGLFENLTSLSIYNLLKLKRDYELLGYSAVEVDSHLHRLYSLPVFLSIMTIITAITMFNVKRNQSLVFHLIFGIFISVIIYYFTNLFNLLGQNGKVPLIFSIYLPFLILFLFILIGLVKINEK
jgi:lipopolysaccharide export system permease protein